MEKMYSKITYDDSKIGDQNTEQMKSDCDFSTISLSFIMCDRRKGSYKRTSGFTLSFLLKISLITCDLILFIQVHLGLEYSSWTEMMPSFE